MEIQIEQLRAELAQARLEAESERARSATETEQLRAELSQARLEVESERARSATAMEEMERRRLSEHELAEERMHDAKVSARRQVENIQRPVQDLETRLEHERKARRFAEKDAEQQRKEMAAHQQIGLADCAAWSCLHDEVVSLIEMERDKAVMAAEEATEEREAAEEECETAELELRNAELEWAAKVVNLKQALAEAESQAAAAKEEAQKFQQAAAEQATVAEDAVRKLEKEQRNAVRARTAKSAQEWQEKRTVSTGVRVTRN